MIYLNISMSVPEKSYITHFSKWFTIPETATNLPDIDTRIGKLALEIAIPSYIYVITLIYQNSKFTEYL